MATGETLIAGAVAPEFEVPDSKGTPRRLSALVATGPLVLIFYRGHW
jgi:thioredoxin-dependent peroxiredoxin